MPFDYVQMCHSACLWAVTTLMGVTVIFDCRPSRWALALTGGETCQKSRSWIGDEGQRRGGGDVRSPQSTVCLDKDAGGSAHRARFQYEFLRRLVGESNFLSLVV